MQIKILPKSVAEKIAAGEVVERPASVVKELCENSIDAEAGRITVEIKDGGISYIRVTDDGCGMDGDDAQIAFRRHATSKIASVDDLDYIRTMGFRGEALYAIAAISEIELKSKMAHNEKGTILNVKAGEIIDAFEGDLPGGTTIIVKNLFYNTPARMKFLKSNKTESAYIEELLEKLAMSHPDISFTFITDGKQKFTTNGNGDLLQVIYSIYGNDVAKNVQKIEYEYEGVRVRGVIGNRETHRSNRNFQSVFVNRRFVKCPMVGKAVEEAHKTHIMVGRHPFFVIDIEVEPSLMDINVHPAKTQVKFANEQVIYKAVYWATKNVLEAEKTPTPPVIDVSFKKPVNPLTLLPKRGVGLGLAQDSMGVEAGEELVIHREKAFETEEIICFADCNTKKEYAIIGQAFGTYILIQQDDKLLLIDQHAAHERQIYEKLLEHEKQIHQPLLAPLQIKLSSLEMQNLLENTSAFEEIGFEIDQLNDSTITLRTTPFDIEADELPELIIELLTKLENATEDFMPEFREKALHSIACKAAIKGNKKLSEFEMREIIDWVLAQGQHQTCPHGRPLTYSFTKYEIEKLFKRVT